jgi:hypothetical protein
MLGYLHAMYRYVRNYATLALSITSYFEIFNPCCGPVWKLETQPSFFIGHPRPKKQQKSNSIIHQWERMRPRREAGTVLYLPS